MLAGIGVTILGIIYVAFLGGFLVATRTGFENHPGLSTKLLGYFFLVIFRFRHRCILCRTRSGAVPRAADGPAGRNVNTGSVMNASASAAATFDTSSAAAVRNFDRINAAIIVLTSKADRQGLTERRG